VNTPTEDLLDDLKKHELKYISVTTPGIFRVKTKNTIQYYGPQGEKITNEKTLTRINNLVIPPAWKDVWICPIPNGHLQATGIDEKGRKQYIYHKEWNALVSQNKFDKVIDFGLSLPKIRQKVSYDLKRESTDKRKIIATIVWLLEHTFLRVGNEEYMKENNSFGLTTLRNKHATILRNEVILQFKGKHGVNTIVEITNPTIIKNIKKCIELPGYELFQFVDENNNRHTIDSVDINEFLQEVTNNDFTAKDFRTWGATNLSSKILYKAGMAADKQSLKENVNSMVKQVAHQLNNTVSVCKNYYIHPTVIKTYSNNALIPHFTSHKNSYSENNGLLWNEHALIDLLKKYA